MGKINVLQLIRSMRPGEKICFPAPEIKTATIRNYASNLSFEMSRKYVVSFSRNDSKTIVSRES